MPSSSSVQFYDKDTEGNAIASLILEPKNLGQAALSPSDFYVSEYKKLFEVILSLWQRNEPVNEKSVKMEAGAAVGGDWIFNQIMSALPKDFDCLSYCHKVKDFSLRRQALKMMDTGSKDISNPSSIIQEVMDKLRLSFESLDGIGDSSRLVKFTNMRILGSQPPSYRMTITSSAGQFAKDVLFESNDLSTQTIFKKKIREHLQINPLLPKNYDAFIHGLLLKAKAEDGPSDATDENTICFWIHEWFKTATEAEHRDDLNHGYIDRDGAYWFKSERLTKYIEKQLNKGKFDNVKLWAVINDRGGRRSRLMSIAGEKERCWGLDHSFFEEKELTDQEQLTLKENQEEDISWLEGGV